MELLSILFICFTQTAMGWFYIIMLAASITCLIVCHKKSSRNLLMLSYTVESIAGIVALFHTIYGNSFATATGVASIAIFGVMLLITFALHNYNREFYH